MSTRATCRIRSWNASSDAAAMGDTAQALIDAVANCRQSGATLAIVGHGSKAARPALGGATEIATTDYAGILDYRPQELVVTARAGTPLDELTAVLAERDQLLPFDPPRFADKGTFGGAIASGLAGPARPWRGNVRDAVLGVEIVNGLGERLRFGGSVMKNVAGYDISRLMVGASGALGLILSASVRVLPAPQAEETWRVPCGVGEAGARCRQWARLPLPITATCWLDGTLSVRLSASASAIASARRTMQLSEPGDADLWTHVRDHRHAYFAKTDAYRRLSLPRGNRFADERALVEWGGCQAWLPDRADAAAGNDGEDLPEGAFMATFPPRIAAFGAEPPAAKYARRLKHAFDPDGIFNPGLPFGDDETNEQGR